MKEILGNISTLNGFLSNDEMGRIISFVDSNEIDPHVCGKYNGPPDEPIDRISID